MSFFEIPLYLHACETQCRVAGLQGKFRLDFVGGCAWRLDKLIRNSPLAIGPALFVVKYKVLLLIDVSLPRLKRTIVAPTSLGIFGPLLALCFNEKSLLTFFFGS